jgi:hypothetical protein
MMGTTKMVFERQAKKGVKRITHFRQSIGVRLHLITADHAIGEDADDPRNGAALEKKT